VSRASRGGTATGPLARIRAALPDLPYRRRGTGSVPHVTFSREEARRLNERFATLDRAERREIVRAVNRGDAMSKRRDAEIAIGVARRQQRFWTRAWLLGPAIAVVQVLVTPIGWMEGLLLAGWGALLLGMMAAWWWTRARRAEMRNLEMLGSRGLRDVARDPRGSGGGAGRRSRLPGHRSGDADAVPPSPSDDATDEQSQRTVARPPRPRGRKRR
jgi:hypothetical protein